MAISAASGGSQVNANINVTPMIDVMLVLLIIFMIVIPTLMAGFEATMPSAANATKAEEQSDELTLGLDINGNYYLNQKPMTKEQVEQQLTTDYATTHTKDKILIFKADENLKYSKIQEAVEIGRRAGARKLMAISDRKGGLMGTTDKSGGK